MSNKNGCILYKKQVSEAGIHRPLVAGIHGKGNEGAYSIVVSGGYEDDMDNGDEFEYTGAGGRDLSGNKRVNGQTCDQVLATTNKWVKSIVIPEWKTYCIFGHLWVDVVRMIYKEEIRIIQEAIFS